MVGISDLPVEMLDKVMSYLPNKDILTATEVDSTFKNCGRAHLLRYRKCTAYLREDLRGLIRLDCAIANFQLGHIKHVVMQSKSSNVRRRNLPQYQKEEIGRPLVHVGGLETIVFDVRRHHYLVSDLYYLRAMIVHHQKMLRSVVLRGNYESPYVNVFGFLQGPQYNAVYPALTSVEVKGFSFSVGRDWNRLLRTVTPNLQIIEGRSVLIASGNYMPEVLRCVKRFLVPMTITRNTCNRVIQAISELNALVEVEMSCVEISFGLGEHEKPNYYEMIYRNCITLTKILMCPCHFLKMWEEYRMMTFPSVTDMVFFGHGSRDLPDDWWYNYHNIFIRDVLFPDLIVITVNMTAFEQTGIPGVGNGLPLEELGHPISMIIYGFYDNIHVISLIGPVVGRINSLRVYVNNFGRDQLLLVSSCFSDVPRLAEFTMTISNMWIPHDEHPYLMDACICGLSIQEVLRLREASRWFGLNLADYQYASVRPSLRFSSIKRLIVNDEHEESVAARWISEVSCHLVFGRKQSLTAVFHFGGLPYLGGFESIEDYVRIVNGSSRWSHIDGCQNDRLMCNLNKSR